MRTRASTLSASPRSVKVRAEPSPIFGSGLPAKAVARRPVMEYSALETFHFFAGPCLGSSTVNVSSAKPASGACSFLRSTTIRGAPGCSKTTLRTSSRFACTSALSSSSKRSFCRSLRICASTSYTVGASSRLAYVFTATDPFCGAGWPTRTVRAYVSFPPAAATASCTVTLAGARPYCWRPPALSAATLVARSDLTALAIRSAVPASAAPFCGASSFQAVPSFSSE